MNEWRFRRLWQNCFHVRFIEKNRDPRTWRQVAAVLAIQEDLPAAAPETADKMAKQKVERTSVVAEDEVVGGEGEVETSGMAIGGGTGVALGEERVVIGEDKCVSGGR